MPLNPAPNAAFVVEVFFSKLPLEVPFFAHNDDAIDEDETDWNGEHHPHGVSEYRERKRPQCESDVHWIAREAIKSMRNDARTRIERNRIGAGAFLCNKSADIQCDSREKEERANYPSKRAVHEAGRDEPFNHERCENGNDK
jgi:hypothetical protein